MRTSFGILILVIGLSSAAFAAPSDIANELSVCEHYSHLNEQLGCSNDNYLMSYGYKYCVRYANYDSDLLPATQEVLQKIRRCLVKDLDDASTKLTCDTVEKFAYDSHVHCYVDSGYCGIDQVDKGLIVAIAHDELRTPNFLKTAAAVLLECKLRE